MSWSKFNLSAVDGESRTLATFQYFHAIKLTKPFKTGTELQIESIPVEIPAATILIFFDENDKDCCNCIEVVTATVTAANGSKVQIVAQSGLQIPCGWIADAVPIDLSNRIYTAEVRKSDSSAALVPLRCNVNASAGTVSVRVALIAEGPNADSQSIPSGLEDLQKIKKDCVFPSHKDLVKNAYTWSLLCQYTGTHARRADREIEKLGYFWVVGKSMVRGCSHLSRSPLSGNAPNIPVIPVIPASEDRGKFTMDIAQSNTFVAPCVLRNSSTGWVLAQANTLPNSDIWVCIAATPTGFTLGIGYQKIVNHGLGANNAVLLLSHEVAGKFVTDLPPAGNFKVVLATILDADNILIAPNIEVEEI